MENHHWPKLYCDFGLILSFHTPSSPKYKLKSSRSSLQRDMASAKPADGATNIPSNQNSAITLSQTNDKTVTFESLQQKDTESPTVNKRDGFEWAYTLGNSMSIEDRVVNQLLGEALEKIRNGNLEQQDIEDYLRQRFDEYEWAHNEADISDVDPDWIAQY